jgi:16S rRNA (cytidine1402-2'-O)-methyltransferase
LSGALFVVATPIGNLGDLGQRTAQTLSQVDVVAAEDTRRTRALLSHLGIQGKRLVKVDAHAASRVIEKVVEDLLAGRNVAVVTDAGTPSVSDPGARLVRAAAEKGVAVVGIPGPSAVTTAAAVSGLVEGAFWFVGFLPRKGEKRRRLLARIAGFGDPIVLFEAPGRARTTLNDLATLDPTRCAVVCRELTKLHEQTLRGTLQDLAATVPDDLRGEVTIVLGRGAPLEPDASEDVDRLIRERMAAGASARDVASELSEVTGRSRRELYARVLDISRETEG